MSGRMAGCVKTGKGCWHNNPTLAVKFSWIRAYSPQEEKKVNAKAVELITWMSPAAWWHNLLNGHYTFHSGGKIIDLNTLLAGLELG